MRKSGFGETDHRDIEAGRAGRLVRDICREHGIRNSQGRSPVGFLKRMGRVYLIASSAWFAILPRGQNQSVPDCRIAPGGSLKLHLTDTSCAPAPEISQSHSAAWYGAFFCSEPANRLSQR